jgi:hypothetical protein
MGLWRASTSPPDGECFSISHVPPTAAHPPPTMTAAAGLVEAWERLPAAFRTLLLVSAMFACYGGAALLQVGTWGVRVWTVDT